MGKKIRMLKSVILFFHTIALLTVSYAQAEESKPEEILNDWSAFNCYTVSAAIEMLAFKNGEKLSKVSREK